MTTSHDHKSWKYWETLLGNMTLLNGGNGISKRLAGRTITFSLIKGNDPSYTWSFKFKVCIPVHSNPLNSYAWSINLVMSLIYEFLKKLPMPFSEPIHCPILRQVPQIINTVKLLLSSFFAPFFLLIAEITWIDPKAERISREIPFVLPKVINKWG